MMTLDLASFASVREFASSFLDRYDDLDVLVDNAGVVLESRQRHRRRQRDDVPGEPPRAVPARRSCCATGSSRAAPRASSWSRRTRTRAPATASTSTISRPSAPVPLFGVYGKTKLANILFTRELARRLDGHRRHGELGAPGLRREPLRPRRRHRACSASS